MTPSQVLPSAQPQGFDVASLSSASRLVRRRPPTCPHRSPTAKTWIVWTCLDPLPEPGGRGVSEPDQERRAEMRSRASRFFWSASGRAWRYFCVVWICAWPMRSITLLRSEPPASSHEACAWRRSCIRTGKSMPLALTAGSHTRVRKVLREIGVPALVAKSRSSRSMLCALMCWASASSQSARKPNVRGSLSLG